MDPQAIIDNFSRNVTKHYFDMNGRVRRQEFWYFVLACVVVFIAAAIVDSILRIGILEIAVVLGLLLPVTGLGARRIQDTGGNGQVVWIWLLLNALSFLIAFVDAVLIFTTNYSLGMSIAHYGTVHWLLNLASLIAWIALVYMWAQPGTTGANQYGPDPRNP
jgi:uncharacterized membrane protein YhaH (DUF805 family)